MKKKIIVIILSILLVIFFSTYFIFYFKNKESLEYRVYDGNTYSIESLKERIGLTEITKVIEKEKNITINETKFKIKIDFSNLNIKYEIYCNKIDNTTKHCDKTTENLYFKNKKVNINETNYSLDNKLTDLYEKFLTEFQLIDEKYLLILLNPDGFNKSGKFILFDLNGEEFFESKNLINQYLDSTEKPYGFLNPILNEKELTYYTCDSDKGIISKNSLNIDTLKSKVLEEIKGICSIKQEYFKHLW